jgi:hypothetical protein
MLASSIKNAIVKFMKRNFGKLMEQKILIGFSILVVLGGLAYVNRIAMGDAWNAWRAPELPPAKVFEMPKKVETEGIEPTNVNSPVEGGYATSQNYILESNPTTKKEPVDPLATSGATQKEVNLAVPFTSQAPYQIWDLPYQEACEEASAIMVDAFFKKKTGKIAPEIADDEIKKIVAFEKSIFGYYEDTTAEETARFIREYYGYTNVIVKPFDSPDDVKAVLDLGYPVIIPAAGKLLKNPNFRNDGPDYHMLVVRGYTPDFFITNDPGTRRGEAYTYSYDTIMNATHDWTGSKATVNTGARVMIVVIP